MSDEHVPAEVFPLADLLCEEMRERGWNTDHVAERMPGDARENRLRFGFILAATDLGLILTDDDFNDLSAAFGASPDFFRNYHATWLKWPDRRSPPEEDVEDLIGPLTAQEISSCNIGLDPEAFKP